MSELKPRTDLHIPRQSPLRSARDKAEGGVSHAVVRQPEAFRVGTVQAFAVQLNVRSIAKLIHALDAYIEIVNAVAAQIGEITRSRSRLLISRISETVGVDP